MVIGSVTLRELSALLSGAAEVIGREINTNVMRADEYRNRAREADHFVTHVLSGPKIFIIGTQDDLESMGS